MQILIRTDVGIKLKRYVHIVKSYTYRVFKITKEGMINLNSSLMHIHRRFTALLPRQR